MACASNLRSQSKSGQIWFKLRKASKSVMLSVLEAEYYRRKNYYPRQYRDQIQ